MLLLTLAGGCGYDRMAGESMGTTYAIEGNCDLPAQRIDATLARVNRRMSTYDAKSELSAFNRAAVGESVVVSAELLAVVAAATALSERTNGAFDATVAPLVALWGFGANAKPPPPAAADVAKTLRRVGYRLVRHEHDPPRLRKLAPVALDLSGVAKGHAVDALAALLGEAGCTAFLIELGGEIRAAGLSANGGRWRIGVEWPGRPGYAATLTVRDAAVATSGLYRQRRPLEDRDATHVIDPGTGYPVSHSTESATIVATSALEADALATALLVMGAETGIRFAERHDIAALFITRTTEGFAVTQSTAMTAHR